jgi:hypothetical protein
LRLRLLIAAGGNVNAIRDGVYSVLNVAISHAPLAFAAWCSRPERVPLLRPVRRYI